MYKEVIRWLKKLNIRVSKNYLRLRLESHSNYPSLLAVKDTLEELKIDCGAFQTDKAYLQKENKPFLIHLNIGDGQLLYFNNIQEAETKIKDFDKHWNGVVMLAAKPETYGNPEHDNLFQKEKQRQFFVVISISLVLASICWLGFYNQSWPTVLLVIINTVGLYFSWLIIQKELGINNAISDKICSMVSHSRCEAVLFSKGGRLNKWLSWGDIGIIFFATSLFYTVLSLLSGNFGLQPYYLLSAFGLLFPIYSLYYQLKVVKQWCMLCNAVLVTLCLNAIVGINFLSRDLSSDNFFLSSIVFLITLVITGCGWQVAKNLFEKNGQLTTYTINFNRFKRSPDVFNGLLLKEELNPAHLPKHDEAIRFGPANAPMQIVMACNPYCSPCATAHKLVDKLYQKNPDKISVAVRFALSSLQETDLRTKAATAILKSVKETNSKTDLILNDWYLTMNYEEFVSKYNPNGIKVTDVLEHHKNWSLTANITGTPTLFINGRKLPAEYNWNEFIELMEFQLQE